MSFVDVKMVELPKLKTNFKGCIYVGIPKSTSTFSRGKNSKPRDVFTNADILAILEHGSPVKNIIPRPLIEPTIKLHKKELDEAFRKAIPIVMTGTDAEIDRYFENLALRIQGWVQMFMLREGQELWKPSLRVLRAEAKGKKANTLIDTGSLRQSIIAYYSRDGKSI